PDRMPVSARWSRKHAHTQQRLCERFAVPVIASVACQDIKAERTLAIVNAAPTAGKLTALTIPQVSTDTRVITVDRKVVEVAGHLYVEAPKNRKHRRMIYPRRTPGGYPLAEKLAARIEEARAEQAAGTNPLGLLFPSPRGKHWRSSNFQRNVL